MGGPETCIYRPACHWADDIMSPMLPGWDYAVFFLDAKLTPSFQRATLMKPRFTLLGFAGCRFFVVKVMIDAVHAGVCVSVCA